MPILINKSSSSSGSSDSWWASKPSRPSTYTYYRKESNLDSLYTLIKDKNTGKSVETEVQKGSSYYKNLANDVNSCNAIYGVAAQDNETCTRFVFDCLNGDKKGLNDSQCINTLKDKNFWNNTKQEVFNEMLPDVAADILDSFGFKKVKYTDTVNNNKVTLTQFEKISDWLSRIKNDNNTSSYYDDIQKNTPLMAYLNMILNKINNNPAILNKNFVERTINTDYNNFKYNGTYLSNSGLSPINYLNNSTSTNSIKSVLNNNMQYNRLIFGLNRLVSPMVVLPQRQMGGGAQITIKQHLSQLPSQSIAKSITKNSPLLRDSLDHAMSRLENAGKPINEDDKRKLYDYVNQLENTENNLIKNIDVIHEYINIILNYSNKFDEAIANETLENISKFNESSGKRINKIQNGIDNVIINIQKLNDASVLINQ